MNSLSDFKQNAIKRGLCSVYAQKWDKVQNIEQLLRLGLDANGCSYFIESIVDGFGISEEIVFKLAQGYINGKFIFNFRNERDNGYDTELYVFHEGDINLRTSNLVVLGCESKIIIKPYCVSNIYVSEKDYSKITFDKKESKRVHPMVEVHVYKGNEVWEQHFI